MSTPYRIPAQQITVETEVSRSRFIATVFNVDSTAAVRDFLQKRRTEMSDANHHVYAFRVGFGNSVIEGLSDDGEPTGTSGPPVMNVLRGSDIGDALVVVTRYFGGTLLGTGGLVRAYSEAAALAIKSCPTTLKIEYANLSVLVEYAALTVLKRILPEYEAEIINEVYTDSVELTVKLPAVNAEKITAAITDMTAGNAYIERLS